MSTPVSRSELQSKNIQAAENRVEAGSPARKALKSSGLQIMRVWSEMEKRGVMERERLALLVENWRGRGQQSEMQVRG